MLVALCTADQCSHLGHMHSRTSQNQAFYILGCIVPVTDFKATAGITDFSDELIDTSGQFSIAATQTPVLYGITGPSRARVTYPHIQYNSY